MNEFSGEDPLEDWLPSLELASTWNAWSEEDRMIQLAGHLKGRALQEWNLLHPDRAAFAQVVETLRSRLDSVNKTVAAQNFRHTTQREVESASDFIRCLERTFRTAYGRDGMLLETRDTLLYGQLQDGLRLQLMRGPAVSVARNYQELWMAAKNEEKCLADLKNILSPRLARHHQLRLSRAGLNSQQATLTIVSVEIQRAVLLQPRGIPQSLTVNQGTGCRIAGVGREMQGSLRVKDQVAPPPRSRYVLVNHSATDTALPTSANSSQPTTSSPAPSLSKTPLRANTDAPVQSPADLLFSD